MAGSSRAIALIVAMEEVTEIDDDAFTCSRCNRQKILRCVEQVFPGNVEIEAERFAFGFKATALG